MITHRCAESTDTREVALMGLQQLRAALPLGTTQGQKAQGLASGSWREREVCLHAVPLQEVCPYVKNSTCRQDVVFSQHWQVKVRSSKSYLATYWVWGWCWLHAFLSKSKETLQTKRSSKFTATSWVIDLDEEWMRLCILKSSETRGK